MTNTNLANLANTLTADIDAATFNAHDRDADDLAGAMIDDMPDALADDPGVDDDTYRAIETAIADPATRDELRDAIANAIRNRF